MRVNVAGTIRNGSQVKNLGLSVESKSRAKHVKALKDAMTRFRDNELSISESMHALNTRNTMERTRAIAGHDVDGTLMLESASNLPEHLQYIKLQKALEQDLVAALRKILAIEKLLSEGVL